MSAANQRHSKIKLLFIHFSAMNLALTLGFAPTKVYAVTAKPGGISGDSNNTGAAPTPSINQGAGKSKSGNGMAQAMNYVTGAMEVGLGGWMIRAGYMPCPLACNYPMIGMGSLMVMMGLTNIAQGQEHGGAAGSAGITGFQTDGFGGPTNPSNPNNTKDPYVQAAINDDAYKAVGPILKDLQNKGIYDPKTGNVKIGDKTYKKSDFASADAMAAAGFSKGMIDTAMSYNADAEKKALAKMEKVKIGASTSENGYAEGGGGGGSGDSSSSGGDDSSSLSASANIAGSTAGGLGREPTNFAGMSKNYNGEPIGVAGDSIFLMMNRRYQLKETQDSFFKPTDITLQN